MTRVELSVGLADLGQPGVEWCHWGFRKEQAEPQGMKTVQRAHIKGEILRWARETMNLEISEAAKKIGVKPDRLEDCENEEALLTLRQLRNAAIAYKRPLAAFFLPEPPRDFHVPHDFRRLPGEPERTLSPELVTAIREAQYRRALAMELAEEVEQKPSSFVGSLSTEADVEQSAIKVRKLLDVSLDQQKSWDKPYDPLNNWKDAIEKAGALVFHFAQVDVEEIRAFSISDVPFPVISVNGGDSPNGRVFSLLHEFGHLLLGHGGTCDFRETEEGNSSDQDAEVFCNYLAGAVLVPASDLVTQPSVREAGKATTWDDPELQGLAKLYGVSRQVILRRLLITGKTSRTFYRTKQQELVELGREAAEKKGGFLPPPRKVVRNVGQAFLRIVLGAYYRESITSSDLAEYIGARLKHLPTIEGLLAGRNILTGSDN
ncbi:MAG: XRE family transcriptional regulator [Planctomycetota bacterium]